MAIEICTSGSKSKRRAGEERDSGSGALAGCGKDVAE